LRLTASLIEKSHKILTAKDAKKCR